MLFPILPGCGSVAAPDNGKVYSTGVWFLDKAEFSCDTGYQLMGNETLMCKGSGNWSHQVPTCEATGRRDLAEKCKTHICQSLKNNEKKYNFGILNYYTTLNYKKVLFCIKRKNLRTKSYISQPFKINSQI